MRIDSTPLAAASMRAVVSLVAVSILAGLVLAAPALAGPWPSSSHEPIRPLDHPTLEERCRATGIDPRSGFRFVAFGDQRALADGEWQTLMEQVAGAAAADPSILFMIDTGDNVQNGSHTDQFRMLEEILSPATDLPYWAGVGNHEVRNNKSPKARAHTAVFLSAVDSTLSPERLYYAKRVGPVQFVFLDTNDLVYGPDGRSSSDTAPSGPRIEAQLAWLESVLSPAEPDPRGEPAATVAILHHPFLQSSEKHREQARRLWDYRYHGRTLADILVEGGVDVVLCGHTHTYERFRLRREDGRELALVNLSGRPRSSGPWPFQASRRAEDLRGRESETFREWGWRGLGLWTFTQEDAMLENEADQFAIVSVEGDGTLHLEIAFLDPGAPEGLRRTAPVLLFRPQPR